MSGVSTSRSYGVTNVEVPLDALESLFENAVVTDDVGREMDLRLSVAGDRLLITVVDADRLDDILTIKVPVKVNTSVEWSLR